RALPQGEPFSTGPVPNFDEGFGLVDLDRTVAPAMPTLHLDEDAAAVLGGPGEERAVEIALADPAAPFGATLAWTDAPAAVGASPALVNDLDLVVEEAGGTTWLGNRFADGESVPGPGPRDDRNNLERAIVTRPPNDVFTVRVRAASVPGDGVPGN